MSALILLLTGCGTTCAVDAPLDYSEESTWLCRPGLERACPSSVPTRTFHEDGSTTDGSIERAESPDLACFLVYPTMDLRIGVGLHHNTEKVDGPENWTRIHGGPLQEQCAVYVPVYRQAIVGTYLRDPNDKTAECLESAYADVLAAFEQFLVDEPERRFVLFGHSQGGQHLSRLIDERIEEDPALLERMVVAYPLGWPVATDEGGLTGGSFDTVEPCTTATQTSCVVAYRSFVPHGDRPSAGEYLEGPEAVCVNPASPDDPSAAATFEAFGLDEGHGLAPDVEGVAEGTLLLWPGAFEGRCDGSGGDAGLEAEWVRSDAVPIDLDHSSVTTGNGSHILDIAFGFEDIRRDIGRRAAGAP